MATTDVIIDYCLKGISQDDVDNPVDMTRAEVLEIINQLYQNEIGKRVRNLASFSYDASDAAHTITAGVGSLPSDFLLPHLVYDGDAPDNEPLSQIFNIEDKVDNDADTSQYMIPDTANLWIYGTTPTNTVKMYYCKKPTVVTDSPSSTPSALLPEFHIGPKSIFTAAIKAEYALRDNNTYDYMDMMALVEDQLNAIEKAHTIEKQDASIRTIRDVYGIRGDY